MTGIWFSGHNNVRYSFLIPRMLRIQTHFVHIRGPRLLRGLQYRVIRRFQPALMSYLAQRARRRFSYSFVTDIKNLRYPVGMAVVDMDDPNYTDEEVELLNLPHVACVVVPLEAAAEKYRQAGVRTPIRVIEQGHNVSGLPSRATLRSQRVLIGFASPFLLGENDIGDAESMYNFQELLVEMWPQIRARCPDTELVLVGQAGRHFRRQALATRGVRLLGAMPAEDVRLFHRSIDIGVYPRRIDHVRSSLKIVEMIASGTPVVGFKAPPMDEVVQSGCGVAVASQSEFVDACVWLALDRDRRLRMSAAGLNWGASRDWDTLGRRYNQLIDEFLS
jgi:glycosyltransferase involved in cell wall biosynthesis